MTETARSVVRAVSAGAVASVPSLWGGTDAAGDPGAVGERSSTT
ncbi:hypothetical protein [Streptomyces shenzhenensis]|nr:hypothetical protein [Streptomyces shenzhenensis]